MLEKTFEAADVEPRIARAWEDAKAFAALMKYAQEDAAAVAREQAAAPASELQPAEYDEIITRYLADLSEGRAA